MDWGLLVCLGLYHHTYHIYKCYGYIFHFPVLINVVQCRHYISTFSSRSPHISSNAISTSSKIIHQNILKNLKKNFSNVFYESSKLIQYFRGHALYASIQYKTPIKTITNIEIILHKTEAILFSHSTIIQRDKLNEKINFHNCQLDWNPAVKYLGDWLDQKLLYRTNIAQFIKKAKKNIATLLPYWKKEAH